MEKEKVIYQAVRNGEKRETTYGILSVCQLYDTDLDRLKEIAKEIKKEIRELEDTDEDLFGESENPKLKKLKQNYEVIKIVAKDIKEEIEKEQREKEINLLKKKLEQVMVEKQEEILKQLSPEEIQKVMELINQGLSLEEAIKEVKEQGVQGD